MTSSALVFLVNPATRQLILAQNETDGEHPLSHLAPVAIHCEEPAKPPTPNGLLCPKRRSTPSVAAQECPCLS